MNDPVILKLVDKYGEVEWRESGDLFEELIEAIISQQLSIKASETIFNRFKNLFGKDFPQPTDVLETSDEKLRGVGISFAKIKYIKDLSKCILTGELDLSKLKKMSDEEVITELTKVKGIGRWTAEMVLIFNLRRPDVFSLGDLGLRKAVSNLYGIDIKDLKSIEEISLKWRPNRSIVCRYLWLSLDSG